MASLRVTTRQGLARETVDSNFSPTFGWVSKHTWRRMNEYIASEWFAKHVNRSLATVTSSSQTMISVGNSAAVYNQLERCITVYFWVPYSGEWWHRTSFAIRVRHSVARRAAHEYKCSCLSRRVTSRRRKLRTDKRVTNLLAFLFRHFGEWEKKAFAGRKNALVREWCQQVGASSFLKLSIVTVLGSFNIMKSSARIRLISHSSRTTPKRHEISLKVQWLYPREAVKKFSFYRSEHKKKSLASGTQPCSRDVSTNAHIKTISKFKVRVARDFDDDVEKVCRWINMKETVRLRCRPILIKSYKRHDNSQPSSS